jgi:hypothetical protein
MSAAEHQEAIAALAALLATYNANETATDPS